MNKRILSVALAVMMLLIVAFPVSAAVQATTVEVRGSVVSDNADNVIANWTSQTFAGFYYDLKNDRQTETLAITENLTKVNTTNSRTISKENLWYNTTKVNVNFKMNEKENVTVLGNTNYQLVGWQAQKYVAVAGKANKLAKLSLEMDKEDKKTLTTGETWSLGSGYELTINAIDARTTPRQVWFTIKKDGAIVDEGIGQAPDGTTPEAKQKAVFTKTQTILGQSDSLFLTLYVDTIFSGATSDMVQFKYAWLIDASTAKEIKSDDVYGVFKVRTTGDNYINLSSDSSVSLSKNTEVTIMGDVKFKVADSDVLRFYPKIDYVIPESGEEGNATTAGTAVGTVKATPNVNATTNATAAPTAVTPLVTTAGPVETVKPPAATATPTEPGFQAVFAIAGLLAVAFLVLRQRK
jgi:S-layer protein (TIGR01567 family)